jgi:hypothetical protein
MRSPWKTLKNSSAIAIKVWYNAYICGHGGMVDALDLGSSFFGSEGSSPFARITIFFLW